MAKPLPNKSQHFVPRTYLAAWCDPDVPEKQEPYVWVFEKDGTDGRRKAPHNLFEETDFYTIRREGGERDLTLEHRLADLESKFADIRDAKLAADKPLTPDEGAYLGAFAVALSFRTKAHRDRRRDQWTAVLKKMKELGEERGPNGEIPTVRWSASADPEAASISYEEIEKLAANPVQYMMAQEIGTYLPLIGRMEMMMVRTDDPIGFITSDDPCVWIGATVGKTPPPIAELGEFGILMPISPRQLLFINPYQSCYGRLPLQVVDILNGYIRRNAHVYFVANRNRVRDAWLTEEGV
jgi:hypothetical protein